MTTTNTHHKSTASAIIRILLVFLLVLTLMPLASGGAMQAEAADIEIQYGVGSPILNVANATTIGLGGKQWVVIGYNGTEGVASDTGTMTLLLANGFSFGSGTVFSTTNATYAGSSLQTAMGNAFDTLRPGEQSIVVPRDLIASTTLYTGSSLDTVYGSDNVTGQNFWPLSPLEANYINNTLRVFSATWWLRSPADNSGSAAVVDHYGGVVAQGTIVNSSLAVRPAFKLKLSSVLFTSAAAGGKNLTADKALEATTSPTGAIKLTVKDNGLQLSSAVALDVTGNDITFTYDASSSTSNFNRISAIVQNTSTGEVSMYGNLKNTPDKVSTATVTVPAGFNPATQKLLVFVEQVNGENATDFASEPVEITMAPPSISTTDLQSGQVNAPYSQTLTATGNDPITWRVVSGALPDGLKLDSDTGVISGIPTKVETASFEITASNVFLTYDTKPFTIDITAAPIFADSSKNQINIPTNLTAGIPFTFTAIGDRQDSPGLVEDDTKYIPVSWECNPSGTFSATAPYTANVTIPNAGTYTLNVTFDLYRWENGGWVNTNNPDVKTYSINVATAGSGTGSANTGDSALPLGLAALAVLAGAGVFLFRRKLTQK